MKLEDQIREVMRFKHYSLRTEESYVGWYRQFVYFHGLRHPGEMGAAEVEAFLSHLAVVRNVVAATQNQALNALVFLFREVLKKEFEGVDAMRAKQSRRLPVVLSVEETRKLLMVMTGEEAVMAKMLYGCGLRVLECLRLRVKDVDVIRLKGGGARWQERQGSRPDDAEEPGGVIGGADAAVPGDS
jgi:site-specific recombinase XerD